MSDVRGAFLHLIADAAVSAGVVVAGVLVWKTGWAWIDPATSIVVSVVILYGTWKLVRAHVWSMSTTEVALTAHLVLPWPAAPPAFLSSMRDALEQRSGIHHITLQLEDCGTVDCAQASAESL